MWIRLGQCNKCGRCCDPATWPKRAAIYRALGIPFMLNPQFPCPYFMDFGSKGFCAIYEQRPQMCRDFPLQPADILGLPECGYRFEARQRIGGR